MLQGYVAREELEKQVQDMLQHSSGASVKSKQREKLIELQGADGNGGRQQSCVETLQTARYRYIKEFPSGISVPWVTRAPAPIMQFLPILAPFNTMAPMPMSVLSPIVHP